MIEIITDVAPVVKIQPMPWPDRAWRILFGPDDEYGIITKSEPKIEQFYNRQRFNAFDAESSLTGEFRDYIILHMRKESKLSENFQPTIKWEDRAEGIELIEFVWWKVTLA